MTNQSRIIRPLRLDQSESLNSLKHPKTYFTCLHKSDKVSGLEKILNHMTFSTQSKNDICFCGEKCK